MRWCMLCGRVKTLPYNHAIGALESVGAGALDGPFVQSKVFSAGASPRPTSTNAPR